MIPCPQLHKLWSKAVGTPDYNKREWIELELLIERLARALVSVNREDYPWKDGSIASKALDEAEEILR